MADRAKEPSKSDNAYDRRIALSLINALGHSAQAPAPERRLALLLELWQRTRLDWGFVTDRLAVAFRAHAWLGSHDRRFIAETLFGLVRGLRRLDAALALAVPPSQRRTITDAHRLVAYWLEQGLIDEAEAGRFDATVAWGGVPRFAASLARAPLRERVAVGESMPDWLATRLIADWGDEAVALAHALAERAPMTIRANLLRAPKATVVELLAEQGLEVVPGRYCDTALVLDSRINLFGIEAFKEGYFEAQDEGSQLLADLTYAASGPRPKCIIDYCAGAGGKTLALAARMSNKGRLVSTDIDDRKLQQLKKRARRAGVSNHQAFALAADAWPDGLHRLVGTADGVLVDAPCSGTGALRRNPEAKWRMQESDIAAFVAKQRQIARKAAALVRPGGVLVYATCSVLAAENAEQARALAAELPGFRLEPVTGVDGALINDEGHFVTAPHRTGTDGFFAAVFRRQE